MDVVLVFHKAFFLHYLWHHYSQSRIGSNSGFSSAYSTQRQQQALLRNSTGKNIFFVKELLTSEYLKPNQGNNYLINKEDYVCHIVSIETSIDENNKVNVTAIVDETDYSLENNDEQGYINCDESKLEEKFSLSIKESTITANIPKKSSVTIMTNLGDYTHQENNTDTNKQITLNIKNIENIPSTEDNHFLVVAQATLVDENNKITTKKISIKAKELKAN